MLSSFLAGLANLESINLSFTAVTDSGLRKSSALSSLKSLNLDAHQITDAGLAALTSKCILVDVAFPLSDNACEAFKCIICKRAFLFGVDALII